MLFSPRNYRHSMRNVTNSFSIARLAIGVGIFLAILAVFFLSSSISRHSMTAQAQSCTGSSCDCSVIDDQFDCDDLYGIYGCFWVGVKCVGSCTCSALPNEFICTQYPLGCTWCTLPGPISGLGETGGKTQTSINWQWADASGATGYGWDAGACSGTSSSSQQNVTCFSCGTTYTMTVWATNACGSGSSSSDPATTLACSPPPPPPATT